VDCGENAADLTISGGVCVCLFLRAEAMLFSIVRTHRLYVGMLPSQEMGLESSVRAAHKSLDPWRLLVPFWLILLALFSRQSLADEYPIVSGSTVMGRNYGYPTGAPQARPARPGDLDLLFEGTAFFKNLELTGHEDDSLNGETFIGFLSPVRLRYKKGENVTVEVGAILGHNFGDDRGLDVAEPLFRVVVEPLPNNYFVAGTLIRTHWIHDALYDDVYAFRDNAEQGFQYRVDSEWLKQDIWLDWRIRETELRSERFNGGNATQFRIGQLWLDGQFYWSHIGGQKNLENRVANNAQFLAGASYGVPLPWLFDSQLRGGGYYLSGYQTEDVGIPASNGSGVEGALQLDVFPTDQSVLRLSAKQYTGDGRYASRGDPLYNKDRYSQFGFSLVLGESHGIRTEIGVVGQLVDGVFMNTSQLHVLWGDVFPLANIRDGHRSRRGGLVSPLVETTSSDMGTHPETVGASTPEVIPPPYVDPLSASLSPASGPAADTLLQRAIPLPPVTQQAASSGSFAARREGEGAGQDGSLLPVTRPGDASYCVLGESPFSAVMTAGGTELSSEPGSEVLGVVPASFEMPLAPPVDDVEGEQTQKSAWQLLPANLLWSPPWANPHEPRCYVKAHEMVDTAIGAAFPILRHSSLSSPDEGAQIDVTFAVFTGFAQDNSRFATSELLLAAVDYHLGVPFSLKVGDWEYKLAYEFTNGHLGDEYAIFGYEYGRLDRKLYPVRARRDDIVLGIGRRFSEVLRIYGQFGVSCTKGDTLAGKSPARYDWGIEWTPKPTNRWRGGPFAAFDMDLRGEHDFQPGTTVQLGWAWTTRRHRQSSLRVAAEYYDGYSTYEQWFDQRTSRWAFGAYYDW
jgi:uncharacterized protein DUF1207